MGSEARQPLICIMVNVALHCAGGCGASVAIPVQEHEVPRARERGYRCAACHERRESEGGA